MSGGVYIQRFRRVRVELRVDTDPLKGRTAPGSLVASFQDWSRSLKTGLISLASHVLTECARMRNVPAMGGIWHSLGTTATFILFNKQTNKQKSQCRR